MTALYAALGVLFFVFAILASIGLHEVGHMVPAKKFGAKVPQYFIGFGPTVWSKQVGETEYGLKAFPLGGFVKIVGMLPPAPAGAPDATPDQVDSEGEPLVAVRKSNTGMFTQLISDARAAEWEFVQGTDADRLFYRLPWWKKVIVMAGGPMVNVAIAFFLFWGIFATVGNYNDRGVDPVVTEVLDCVVPYARQDQACQPGDPETPAKQAGLQVGDRFVSINGTEVTSWEQLQGLIRGNADGAVTIVVDRDGEPVTLHTNTTVTARPTSQTDETLEQVGFLGVVPKDLGPTHGGPLYTAQWMGSATVDVAKALGTLPVKVWHVGLAAVGVEKRDNAGPVSVVGGARIAGEVAASDKLDATDTLVTLLTVVAGFNLFIGLFNFIPLLPLDGGHIAGALYEAVRRGIARLRHRPDPGYVDVAKLLPVAYVVGAALLVMGLVLIVGDIVAPVDVGL
ncbi:RIP metalloprotease [Nocardioides sp.]|uniref:M50 family metallopeptidase n=1 Tax=Nocardioides sp. TaxID=35761 RepID=UPI003528E35D